MNTIDTRQSRRDSLFLLGQLRVGGLEALHPVKIRNLSPRGMMAEGDVDVPRGTPVSVELRQIGWVEGIVAWKQDNRFGIALIDEIDPSAARFPSADVQSSVELRPAPASAPNPASSDPARLRKI